jgi:hypothetical protein
MDPGKEKLIGALLSAAGQVLYEIGNAMQEKASRGPNQRKTGPSDDEQVQESEEPQTAVGQLAVQR